jgi:hypothetical protein
MVHSQLPTHGIYLLVTGHPPVNNYVYAFPPPPPTHTIVNGMSIDWIGDMVE